MARPPVASHIRALPAVPVPGWAATGMAAGAGVLAAFSVADGRLLLLGAVVVAMAILLSPPRRGPRVAAVAATIAFAGGAAAGASLVAVVVPCLAYGTGVAAVVWAGRRMPPAGAAATAAALVLLPGVITGPVGTAARASEDAAGSNTMERVDAFVRNRMRVDRIPGVALGIIQDGSVVHVRGFGVSGPDGGRVTEDTRFRIGSVTKSFTALAVLQLVEEGRIDLDAPLERYVTGFHLAGEDQPRVTIRHLLSHTSGVGTWTGWRDFADPDDDFAAMVREAGPRTTLVAPPGERFEYANANYVALGAVIEAVTGQRMEDYLTERVFAPLGLDDTSATDDGGLAAGYTSWFGLTVPREVDYPRVLLPTGGITSSATDMLSYLQALSPEDEDDAIVPSGVVDAMHTRSVLLDRPKSGRDLAMSGYGLGWFVEEDGTRWHAGRMPNAASVVAMGPSDDWGFVLLANTDTFVDPPVPALAEGVADVLSGRGIDPMPGPGRYLFVDLLAVLCVALCLRSVTRIRSRPARVSGVIGPAVAAVVIVLGVPLAAGLGAELGSPEAVWAVWRALLGAQPDIAVGGIAVAFGWAACATTVAVRSIAVRPEVVSCSG